MHHYHYYGFFSTVSNHCTHCETTVTLSISEGNKIILINFSWKFPKCNRITARLILHYVYISYLYLDLERKKKNFQAKKKSIFQLSLSTPKCYSSTSLITSIKDHQSCPFLKNNDFLRERTVCIFVGTGALFRNERPWLPTKFMVYLHWWQQYLVSVANFA